jgi:hypothetical protein
MNPLRRLLTHGINELLEKKLISLIPPTNDAEAETEKGHVFTDLIGHPSVVLWENIGHDELRVSVWWNYDHSLHPQANLSWNSREMFSGSEPLARRSTYKRFVGAIVSGWLERKDGRYLMGDEKEGLVGIYTRIKEKSQIESIPIPKPNGFLSQGQTIF